MLRSSADGTSVICLALCKASETHSGAKTNAGGVAPHTCASRGATGAECRYWWWLEETTTATSPLGNTLASASTTPRTDTITT